MKRILTVLLFISILSLSGCSFFTGEFSYMDNLKKTVLARYGTEKVEIKLINSDELVVVFKDPKFEELKPEEKQRISREIGILANALREDEPHFHKGSVEFVLEENYIIASRSTSLSYSMYDN